MSRGVPIKLCILAALAAVFFGVQVSLYNFNQDTGFTPPVKILNFQQVGESGFKISFLSHSWQVNEKEVETINKRLEMCISKAEAAWQKANRICRAAAQKGRALSEEAVHKWKQAVNNDSFNTVKCWADEVFNQ